MSRGIRSRLRQRFPGTSADEIDACLYGAVMELASARVRNFLPILIERRAAEALSARPIFASVIPAHGPGDLVEDDHHRHVSGFGALLPQIVVHSSRDEQQRAVRRLLL
jgi:hypothetical protein